MNITRHHKIVLVAMASLMAAACDSNVTDFDENSDAGPSCQSFEDEPLPGAVIATVRNEGSAPIFLAGAGCTTDIELSVTDPDGQDRVWQGDNCTFTCEELQESAGVCTASCSVPPVIMIAPGGSYDIDWNATLFEDAEMPEACFLLPRSPGPQGCFQRRVAADGNYTLSTTVWSEVFDFDDVKCHPGPTGACQLDGFAQVTGSARKVSGWISYPSKTNVDIIVSEP